MTLVVLSDVVMPNSVMVAGLTGSRTRQNDRTKNQGGYASVNAVNDVSMLSYQIGTVPMTLAIQSMIVALFEVTDAGCTGFLLEDPVDSTCTEDEGQVLLADGVFTLWKRYTAPGGTQARDRRITRPRAGIAVYIDGVPMVSGFSVSVTTGVVTISSPVGGAVYTWSGRYYVPVHFREDTLEWELIVSGPYAGRMTAMNNIYLDEVRE